MKLKSSCFILFCIIIIVRCQNDSKFTSFFKKREQSREIEIFEKELRKLEENEIQETEDTNKNNKETIYEKLYGKGQTKSNKRRPSVYEQLYGKNKLDDVANNEHGSLSTESKEWVDDFHFVNDASKTITKSNVQLKTITSFNAKPLFAIGAVLILILTIWTIKILIYRKPDTKLLKEPKKLTTETQTQVECTKQQVDSPNPKLKEPTKESSESPAIKKPKISDDTPIQTGDISELSADKILTSDYIEETTEITQTSNTQLITIPSKSKTDNALITTQSTQVITQVNAPQSYDELLFQKSHQLIHQINPNELDDKSKMSYIKTTLNMLEILEKKKERESQEKDKNERAMKEEATNDLVDMKNLMFITSLIVFGTWLLAMRILVGRMLQDVGGDWWEFSKYMMETFGVITPSKNVESWSWSSPLQRFPDLLYRAINVFISIFIMIITTIVAFKVPRVGVLAVFAVIFHMMWLSVFRLFIYTGILQLVEYCAYQPILTNRSTHKNKLKFMLSAFSVVAAIGIGLFCARGDPKNPYRITFEFEEDVMERVWYLVDRYLLE